MDWPEIEKRIATGEDHHTEFKKGLANLSKVGRAICAFANSDGGIIVLGVDDSGSIEGVRGDPAKTRERLTSFLQSGCGHPISAAIGSHHHGQAWICWIEVPRQRSFEPARYGGRVWVRRDRSNVEPSAAELQDLFNAFGYIITEERAIRDATESHIELDAFYSYLRRMGVDVDQEPKLGVTEDLRNSGALVDMAGEDRASLYGVLAFGRQPQRYPQTRSFRVTCAAYAGADRASEVLQAADAAGRLDEQVERALGWFKGLGWKESYTDIRRVDRHLLPAAAIREAIVNAVIHRDYAILGAPILFEVFCDRVVLTSPGTLPNNMKAEQVRAGAHPRARNEAMAHFMTTTRYMERRGRGWLLMCKEMREFNGTEPLLEADRDKDYVRVEFSLDADGT